MIFSFSFFLFFFPFNITFAAFISVNKCVYDEIWSTWNEANYLSKLHCMPSVQISILPSLDRSPRKYRHINDVLDFTFAITSSVIVWSSTKHEHQRICLKFKMKTKQRFNRILEILYGFCICGTHFSALHFSKWKKFHSFFGFYFSVVIAMSSTSTLVLMHMHTIKQVKK